MRLKLNTVFAVITLTAVIHNLAIEENEDIPEEWLEDINEEQDVFAPQQNNEHLLGRQTRQLLINNHFARLHLL
jgi:hypothetical protein